MSRHAKGTRKDVALLKKLRNAKDASFSPSELLEGASKALQKANQIKGFLSEQRQRIGCKTIKAEWLLSHQQLREERDAIENELVACLGQLTHARDGSLPEVDEVIIDFQTINHECNALQQQLHGQVHSLSQVSRSIRAYGTDGLFQEVQVLRSEISGMKEDIQHACQQLSQSEAAAVADIKTCWPSAVAPQDGSSSRELFARSSSSGTDRALGPQVDRNGAGASGASGAVPAAAGLAPAAAGASRDLTELQEVFLRYPVASEALKSRIGEVFQALQHKFSERLATLQQEYELSATAGSISKQHQAAACWLPEEHSMFLMLRERYFKHQPATHSSSRDTVMARIAAQLPGRTPQDVMLHNDWYTGQKLLNRKRRDASAAWLREKRQFLEDSECLLQESAAENAAKAQAAAERLAHELTRQHWHEELQELRSVQAAQMEVEAAAQAAAQARELEKQRQEEERRRQEAAAKKELVAIYRQELQRKYEEELAQAAAAAEEAARWHAELAEYNRERVEWRTAEYLVKMDRQKEVLMEKEEEEQLRLQRLARLRALVAPDVEADPMRLLQPTAASAAVVEPAGRAFKSVHGYTNQQLFKDQRFKIMEALQRHGLHQTEYGRRAISLAQTAKSMRPDNVSNFKFT